MVFFVKFHKMAIDGKAFKYFSETQIKGFINET